MPPPPYKLVIWRNEAKRDDCIGIHTSIFDYDENPMPGLKGDSLRNLVNSCATSLKFTENLISTINSAEGLKDPGHKYTLVGMDIYANDWLHRALVLKLVNFNKEGSTKEEVKEVCNPANNPQVLCPPDYQQSALKGSFSWESTRNYQPPYKLAIIQKRGKDYSDLSHVLLPVLGNSIPQLHKSPHAGDNSLLNLCGWHSEILSLVQKITYELNHSTELQGTSGQYYIVGSNRYDDGDSCYVVWKLENSQAAFMKAMAGTIEDKDSVYTSSGQTTPTSTVF
ncbi:hypothetical protein AA313_de0209938 [Arthrobotrys entomopaga]|nr:hypothetical protein AA313_de0209938 [Arthrobotrys entomopaga]